MDMQPQFPPDRRRDDHKRNSEAEVYDQLAHSGQALHEPKALPEAPELDFCVWFEGLGWFGLEVKGGRYSVDRTV